MLTPHCWPLNVDSSMLTPHFAPLTVDPSHVDPSNIDQAFIPDNFVNPPLAFILDNFVLKTPQAFIPDTFVGYSKILSMINPPQAFIPDNFVGGFSKIVIGFWQIVGSFTQVYAVEWPKELREMWGFISTFIAIDIWEFPGLGCITREVPFVDKLTTSTMFLPMAVVLLSVPTILITLRLRSRNIDRNANARYRESIELFCFALLFLMFVSYPTISRMTLSSLSCTNLGTDGNFIRSDVRVQCPSTSSLVILHPDTRKRGPHILFTHAKGTPLSCHTCKRGPSILTVVALSGESGCKRSPSILTHTQKGSLHPDAHAHRI
jgi:hypothetical protein